jgi:hypothetical protein
MQKPACMPKTLWTLPVSITGRRSRGLDSVNCNSVDKQPQPEMGPSSPGWHFGAGRGARLDMRR